MDNADWITPQEALRLVSTLPHARLTLARWIEWGRIKLKAVEVVRFVDDPDGVPPEARMEYAKNLLRYEADRLRELRRQLEYPAARENPSPDLAKPTAPIPPLKREVVHDQIVPVDRMTGVNFACDDFWNASELAPRIDDQVNPKAHMVFSGVRLCRRDVAHALELAGNPSNFVDGTTGSAVDVQPTGHGPLRPTMSAGTPGRPSSMHIIEGLFKERVARGYLAASMAAEARALIAAFQADPRFRELRCPQEKSISNKLGASFRAANTAQNSAANSA